MGAGDHAIGHRRRCHSAMNCQCLCDDLVHVVVFVRAEPPDESHIGVLPCQRFVLFIERLVFRSGNGIIWISVSTRKLIRDTGFRMNLAGQILVFRHPGVRHCLGRVVHNRDRQKPSDIMGFMLKL